MNTNQDNTLTNQDSLPENLKLFINEMFLVKQNGISYYDIHNNVFLNNEYQQAWLSWQAATKASEQRIQELTASNNQLREALNNLVAENKRNREEASANTLFNVTADRKAQQLLSSTPTQSLAQHDNEVIERCAKSIDEMVNVYTNNCNKYKIIGSELDVERNINKGRAAMSCAEVIRALKVTP